MPNHHTDQRQDERLEALEIKASYTDDLLEKLDQVIVRQQAQIDLLILEIQRLRQPVADVDGVLRPTATSDRPPHY
jgi:SlyX protein